MQEMLARLTGILYALLTSSELDNTAKMSVYNIIRQGGLNTDNIVQGGGAKLIRDHAPGAN